MLKKSANDVLASLRASTLKRVFRRSETLEGAYPVAKIHFNGRTAHTKCGTYLLASRLLRPCMGKWASRRAGVGRLRSLAFLSILELL